MTNDSLPRQPLPQSLLRGGARPAAARHHRRDQEESSSLSETAAAGDTVIDRASGTSLFSKVQENDGYTTSYVCELRKEEDIDVTVCCKEFTFSLTWGVVAAVSPTIP